jgi:hypothetical protein
MISTQQLLLITILIMASALLIGSTGASSVTVDRGVDMSVVADQQAMVGFEQVATQPDNGTTDVDVTVENQFASEIELTTVELGVDRRAVDVADPSPLTPGDRRTHTFVSVPCSEEITVHVSGTDVNTRFTRSVQC